MSIQKILVKKNYINGEYYSSKKQLIVKNKYSQKTIAEIALADAQQVELAIQSAVKSFYIFKKYSAEKRAQILENIYKQLKQKEELFAELIALEGGKPISYARSEVNRALDNLQTGIRETLLFTGEKIPMDYLNGKGKTAYTIRQPMGVVLGFTPFNFPLNLVLHKLIPAIAVGTSIILKPAPQAPLTLLALSKILEKTELPKGAVNIIITTNENAQKMVEDERIKILSFTGSDKIGWMLKGLSGKKKVMLELGGNAAAIVDKTANIKPAVRKLVYGSFLNAGQICISTQRIFVVDEVYEEFLNYFIHETQKVVTGEMMNKNVINSSMISHKDLLRVKKCVDEAVQQGAKIVYGGRILDEKANLFEPTILTNTNVNMRIFNSEAFAPIVLIEKSEDVKQAIELVNQSRYGLQASVFTDSLENMLLAQEELDVGGVIINDAPGFRIDSMPYGGVKDSGIGREGAKYVMQEFTEPKLIVLS